MPDVVALIVQDVLSIELHAAVHTYFSFYGKKCDRINLAMSKKRTLSLV